MKPMLSASLDGVDLSTLRYPLLASPKLDGVRCLMIDGVAYSRNMKPIRNWWVQHCLKGQHGLDGELIVGSPTEGNVLGRTQSGVMAYQGQPPFRFHVFDYFGLNGVFSERLEMLNDLPDFADLVEQQRVFSHGELLEYEAECLLKGYEGVMVRDPNGPYKEGRSTVREGYLMKLKRFIDGEATVVGLEEAMENTNIATLDELGRTKRSKEMAGLVPKGMVGAILVVDPVFRSMRLSPGVMTGLERLDFWKNPQKLIGKTVHWRAFGYGMKDTPRFPRYYGIREDV